MKNVAKPKNFEHLVHVLMPKKVILLARFPTRRDDFLTKTTVSKHDFLTSLQVDPKKLININAFSLDRVLEMDPQFMDTEGSVVFGEFGKREGFEQKNW